MKIGAGMTILIEMVIHKHTLFRLTEIWRKMQRDAQLYGLYGYLIIYIEHFERRDHETHHSHCWQTQCWEVHPL